jgi:hypothetical protein
MTELLFLSFKNKGEDMRSGIRQTAQYPPPYCEVFCQNCVGGANQIGHRGLSCYVTGYSASPIVDVVHNENVAEV